MVAYSETLDPGVRTGGYIKVEELTWFDSTCRWRIKKGTGKALLDAITIRRCRMIREM